MLSYSEISNSVFIGEARYPERFEHTYAESKIFSGRACVETLESHSRVRLDKNLSKRQLRLTFAGC
ncbi:hypothetical protein E2320_011078 [Naja naja]|nr:hypothetical protein E2320_011078 [Naja naja]